MAVSAAVASPENSTSNANTNFARSVIEFDSFTLPTSAANGVGVDFRGFSGGSIKVSGACTITWYSNPHSLHKTLTTPVAALDGECAAITQTFAGAGIAELPVSLFGKPWVYPVSGVGSIAAVISLKK